MAPLPELASEKAAFNVVCGLFGGSTFTSATDPIIVTDVPEEP
jgi:hypothetical protein